MPTSYKTAPPSIRALQRFAHHTPTARPPPPKPPTSNSSTKYPNIKSQTIPHRALTLLSDPYSCAFTQQKAEAVIQQKRIRIKQSTEQIERSRYLKGKADLVRRERQ